MKFKSFLLRSWVLAVFLVICFTGCERKREDIKIGGIYPLTGRAATFGQWAYKGTDLAIEEINASGGVGGIRLKHVVLDTQSDPKLAVSAYQKAVTMDKVAASIGFVSSGEAMACAPLAERYNSVFITPVAGAEELKTAGDFVFRTRESSSLQAEALAMYAVSNTQIRKVIVLYENAANSIAYTDAFARRFNRLGGEIMQELAYEPDAQDFKPLLLQILKQKESVDAVYAPGISTQIGLILKQAAEIGLNIQWLSSAGIEDPKLFELAGNCAEGVVFSAPQFSLDSTGQKTKEFIENYRKKYSEEPSVYAANAYDSVYLLSECWKGDVMTGQALVRALYQIKDYSGASGYITFDAYGEVQKPSVIKKIVNKKFILLGDV